MVLSLLSTLGFRHPKPELSAPNSPHFLLSAQGKAGRVFVARRVLSRCLSVSRCLQHSVLEYCSIWIPESDELRPAFNPSRFAGLAEQVARVLERVQQLHHPHLRPLLRKSQTAPRAEGVPRPGSASAHSTSQKCGLLDTQDGLVVLVATLSLRPLSVNSSPDSACKQYSVRQLLMQEETPGICHPLSCPAISQKAGHLREVRVPRPDDLGEALLLVEEARLRVLVPHLLLQDLLAR